MRRFYGQTMLAAGFVIGLAAMVGAQPPAAGAGMRGQGMGMRQGMGTGQGTGMRQGMGMRRGMGPGGGPMAALELTPKQHEEIRAIVQKERDANQATMQRVSELRKQMHEAIYARGDEKAAVGFAAEIATVQATHRVQMQLAVKAVLTPEQVKILLDSGMDFPPAGMGPGGVRGGPPPVKK